MLSSDTDTDLSGWLLNPVDGPCDLRQRSFSHIYTDEDDQDDHEEESSDSEPLSSYSSRKASQEQEVFPQLVMQSNALQSRQLLNMNHEYFVRTVQRMNIALVFLGLCATVTIIVISYSSKLLNSNDYRRLQAPPLQHQQVEDFDIHMEHPWNGKEGGKIAEVKHPDHEHSHTGGEGPSIAIGCAVTTKNIEDLTLENIAYRIVFLRSLLPSFCKTCSAKYQYHFYVAFDQDDLYLNQETYLRGIHSRFEELVKELCPKTSNYSMHFVQCSHSKNPTWAQNDAMMEAYLDNMDYYYRVNDDTQMLSPEWTETFIETLSGFNPANVGVVGPLHKGGNEAIMTYDFVHKTHIDIFGYYYPRMFTDWWADDWMTEVYGSERTIKLPNVRLMHTQEAGQRYKVQWENHKLVHYQIDEDKKALKRYLEAKTLKHKPTWDANKRVISMSLWGNEPRYTFGALRNAQTVQVFFPGWTLRVYVEKPDKHGKTQNLPVSPRMLNKLENLGVQLAHVDVELGSIPPMMWRFLAADDTSLDYFIVRDADSRLSDRDSIVVEDWIRSNTDFHCVRDHPSHSSYSLLGGMWGAKPSKLKSFIPIPWQDLMLGYTGEYIRDMAFLSNAIWPKVKDVAYCHDSVSCQKWSHSHPFPVARDGAEHIGQVFDAFGNARDEDVKGIQQTPINTECDPTKNKLQNIKDEVHGAGIKAQPIKPSKDTNYLRELEAEALEEREKTSVTSPVIWSMDYHIGPVRDIKHLLEPLGLKFVDKSLSSHCNLTNTCAFNLRVITKLNGLTLSAQNKLSFYREYESDPEMKLVTHFFCSYPASMCELYQAFDKPIIVYITSRYEHGRFTKTPWKKWNQNLIALSKNPKNLLAANNLYDKKYVEFFTGIKAILIPSVCDYVNATYQPSRKEILLARTTSPHFVDTFLQQLSTAISKERMDVSIKSWESLSLPYKFSDFVQYEAIIHVPYQVSTISFCEHYQMNIPMFLPSLELLIEWHLKYRVLSQLTWNSIRTLSGEDTHGIPMHDHNNSSFHPNMDDNRKGLEQWIQFADFYQRPHIIYFTSIQDLVEKIDTVDLAVISERMKQYNNDNMKNVVKSWQTYFKSSS